MCAKSAQVWTAPKPRLREALTPASPSRRSRAGPGGCARLPPFDDARVLSGGPTMPPSSIPTPSPRCQRLVLAARLAAPTCGLVSHCPGPSPAAPAICQAPDLETRSDITLVRSPAICGSVCSTGTHSFGSGSEAWMEAKTSRYALSLPCAARSARPIPLGPQIRLSVPPRRPGRGLLRPSAARICAPSVPPQSDRDSRAPSACRSRAACPSGNASASPSRPGLSGGSIALSSPGRPYAHFRSPRPAPRSFC